MIRTHFETLRHRKDGSFAVASSALTGQVWDGNLWVFKSIQDFQECPNMFLVNTRTSAGISDAVWLSDEQNLVAASDSGELEVWSCKPLGNSLEQRGVLKSHDDMALCLCRLGSMAVGGDKVVSGGADGRVIVWDVTGSQQLRNYRAHSQLVTSIAGSPHSADIFVSTSQDGAVRIWDLRLPKPARNIKACSGGVYASVAWAEQSLALGGEMGALEVLDLRNDQFFLQTHNQLHTLSIHRLTFAPWDSSLLASVSDDRSVKVRSIRDNKTLYESDVHVDFVRGASWDPDPEGRGLLTCGWDGKIIHHTVPCLQDTEPMTVTVSKDSVSTDGMEQISHSKLGTENGYVNMTTQSVQCNMEP